MSALAELVLKYGYRVSGSDQAANKRTQHLASLGIEVFKGHHPSQIEGSDLVIYTDAVSLDNQELSYAIKQKIDVVDRASFLGAVMKNYDISIAVSGTHGKTTTTSMITAILKDQTFNPTILLGGDSDVIKGNAKIGDEAFFLTEACEYRANILKYFPTTAIVLNIDEDHLDYFDNIQHIIETFKGYASHLGPEDFLIINVDDPHAQDVTQASQAKCISLSSQKEADYQAKNIQIQSGGRPSYDLYIHGKKEGSVQLQVMGLHNVNNSLAAIAACHINGLALEDCIQGVKDYTGVHRRLEYKGEKDQVVVFDDYAHHPTEITSTLKALRPIVKNRLICIFQPHTFTRTRLLLDSFSKAFSGADQIIITDIYAAREKDYGDIHSRTLVEAIKDQGDAASYISSKDQVLAYLKEVLEPGDLLVTIGAGDIYEVGEAFIGS